MKSRNFLIVATVSLIAIGAWAFLPLLGGYSDHHDAPFRITKAELERDHSDYWLTLTLKGELPPTVDEQFGLVTPAGKLVRGVTAEGHSLPTRFWINDEDLEQALQLQLQGVTLEVKAKPGLPELENGATRVFHSSDWSR